MIPPPADFAPPAWCKPRASGDDPAANAMKDIGLK